MPEFVAPLRAFVERGGGLVVAGSALHWSWWIERGHGAFTGNTLLRGTGISWNEDSIETIASASTRIDLRALTPGLIWGQYLSGGGLDAAQMSLLPGLFSAALDLGRTEELDLALVRLVRETPALPISSATPLAHLSAEVAETLGPHEWPETHPWAAVFPGLPHDRARRIDGTVTVDASRREFPADASRRESHLPLGFYAPPGALVTIEVPAGHATGELRVSVGELHDDLGEGYAAKPMWRRAPWLRREFAVTDRRTRVANAYGGSIALVVPADYERGTVQVTVRGAIPMAVYTDGESNAAAWLAALDAGAPQAIIQKMGGIRLVISTENARGVDDPGEVSAFWDGFNRHHAELSGEPAPRAFESIWIFDPQVGHGYANAGRVRINYPLHGEHWVLLPGTSEGREYIARLPDLGPQPNTIPPSKGYSPTAHGVDWWLFGHELGHQWQTEDWTGHGITEVGVNLFTMYTLNYHVYAGGDSNVYTERKTHGCAAPLDHAALASRRWSTSDDCEKLALYRQLISEFGWDTMKAVFHSYYDKAYPRSTYGGSLDGFAIRFSAIAQRDLVSFFRHWEYPLSDSAAATIRSLGLDEWLPPGW
ncbi:MAG: M60 family metallopeptidase [Truepera sp.]|nr:M60 family metallopeptidase [Truepera sp.]